MDNLAFKIALVGNGGVGKTTFAKRYLTSGYETNYMPTLGVEVSPIRLNSTIGPLRFNIWDCAGAGKYSGLRVGYYILSNAALIMYDVTDPQSKEQTSVWERDLRRVFDTHPVPYNMENLDGNYPIVTFGNKKDRITEEPEELVISCKTNEDLYIPLLLIARQLTNTPDLEFIE